MSKKGLTLVELLIVITIIGLLASVFAINVSKWRAKSRDSQRAADIRTIQHALAMYQEGSGGSYPICDCNIDGSSDCLSAALNSAGVTSVVPVDPLSGTNDYYFCSYELDANCTSSDGTDYPDGTSYILKFYLETSGVPGKVQGWNIVTP